jgi:galactonate dehydratase
VQTPLRRVGTHWEVPLGPGLGVEINEAEAARHPFKQEVMHATGAVLDDGTIVEW